MVYSTMEIKKSSEDTLKLALERRIEGLGFSFSFYFLLLPFLITIVLKRTGPLGFVRCFSQDQLQLQNCRRKPQRLSAILITSLRVHTSNVI